MQRKAQIHVLILRIEACLLVVHYGNVRTGSDMLREHVRKCGVIDGMAACEHDVALGAAANVAEHGAQRIDGAAVNARVVPGDERGQDEKAVPLAVQIPFLSGLEVIHQRVVILLRNDPHVGDARVHKA